MSHAHVSVVTPIFTQWCKMAAAGELTQPRLNFFWYDWNMKFAKVLPYSPQPSLYLLDSSTHLIFLILHHQNSAWEICDGGSRMGGRRGCWTRMGALIHKSKHILRVPRMWSASIADPNECAAESVCEHLGWERELALSLLSSKHSDRCA